MMRMIVVANLAELGMIPALRKVIVEEVIPTVQDSHVTEFRPDSDQAVAFMLRLEWDGEPSYIHLTIIGLTVQIIADHRQVLGRLQTLLKLRFTEVRQM